MTGFPDAEKTDFNSMLQGMMNAVFEAEGGNGKLALRVEDLDMGVFLYPDARLVDFLEEEYLGDLVYPVYPEDLTVDAFLLAEMLVREGAGGLISKVLMRLHINENREVEIKNKTIYETEIVGRDITSVTQRKAVEEMLEEKTNVLAAVLKGALERIISEEKARETVSN